MTPLPWLTRCTGTPSSSALSKTARSAFGPSTEGISTRHCPPSENRCVELGRLCRSPEGSPIPSRNRRVCSIPLLLIPRPHSFPISPGRYSTHSTPLNRSYPCVTQASSLLIDRVWRG